jgi:putative aminopeptidase FrvX
MRDEGHFNILADLASIPTASFHESAVAGYVATCLRDLGIPFEVDLFGNLIAEYRNGASDRPVALVAHLDHPAIEISEILSPTEARAVLLGGVPAACFDRPVLVSMVTISGPRPATIVGRDVNPASGRVASLHILHAGDLRPGDWGVFDIPPYSRSDDEIAMRAADDLAGVAAALEALKRITGESIKGIVYGVFTRAEEVGLVGAAVIAGDQRLPLDTIVISLECSRALPGAEIGAGPIIRVGDRTGAFHPAGEAVLLAARDLLPDTPIQRQLMSGGTCEATAFVRAGYRATGIALSLGNYHNVGPGNVIAPELIGARDYLGEIELLVAAARVARLAPDQSPYVNADKLGSYRSRLAASAAPFRALTAE